MLKWTFRFRSGGGRAEAIYRATRVPSQTEVDRVLARLDDDEDSVARGSPETRLQLPMAQKPQVDFLYFDLGKVLIDFSYEIGAQRLSELTGRPIPQLLATIFGGPNQIAYETGLIETADFAREINQQLGTNVPAELLVQAATEIFWPNWQIIPLVASLARAGWPLGILSNTCSAHWEYVTANYRFLRHLFGGPVILSYEVRAMKPAEPIYAAAQRLAGVDSQRIFFVDDRAENVEGARQFGFQAVLYESAIQTAASLRQLGVHFDY